MQDDPKVSVVMPVYNAEPFVGPAIESVLKQTFTDFEFIIINDGSTDSSTEVLRRYDDMDERIRLVEQRNQGITPTLNRGVALARGKYIARMDADDICLPERFQLQVDYLDAHSSCVLVGGNVEPIDQDGKTIQLDDKRFGKYVRGMNFPQEHDAIEERLLTAGWAFMHPTVMMCREAVTRVGGYNPKIKDAEDVDLFIRLAEIGRVANLPDTLLKYRYHDTQISSTSSVQMYWMKRARRAGYLRRGLPLPEELRLFSMLRSAIGSKLRKTALWPHVLTLYNRIMS